MPPEFYPKKLKILGLSPKVLLLGNSRDTRSLGDSSSSAPRHAGVLFRWKRSRGCREVATRGPCLRPWLDGYWSSHRGVWGSRSSMSCFLLPRVQSVCFGVSLRLRINQRCVELLPVFWCASRPVIQAFLLFLLCSAPRRVVSFPTGLYPVGFEDSNQYKTHLCP